MEQSPFQPCTFKNIKGKRKIFRINSKISDETEVPSIFICASGIKFDLIKKDQQKKQVSPEYPLDVWNEFGILDHFDLIIIFRTIY
jgi:hypothetical protein